MQARCSDEYWDEGYLVWYQCPTCDHVWEAPAGQALARYCPWCGQRFEADGECTCAMNCDGSPELPHDADCPVHGEDGQETPRAAESGE